MKKKVRRLKRFLGVSAIILAVLLANIPFPSEAEGDTSVSGGDPTGTTTTTEESETETEEIDYELTIVDNRSGLSGTSSVTLGKTPDELKKNVTVEISGSDTDATGHLETTSRYSYQTITITVKDTDTGADISDFGTCTAWIALPSKMDIGGGVVKVFPTTATSSSNPDTTVEQSDSSTADYLKMTFTSATYERVIQYFVYYVNAVNSDTKVDTLGFYKEVSGSSVLPTFVGARRTKDWDLKFSAIQSTSSSKLLPLLEADSSITYDDIELADISLYFSGTNDKVVGGFTRCTIKLQAPPRMPLSSGSIKMYSVLNGNLDPLPITLQSGQYFEFTTTHFTEFALLYTKNPNAGGGGGNASGGGNSSGDSGSSDNSSHNDRDDDASAVVATTVAETETVAVTETETETVETVPVVVTDTTVDTGAGTGNTQITMNSGNKGTGRKNGSVDMPKTGDADTYRYVGVLMLLFFGIFELISSIPAGKRRTAGR